MDVEMYSCELTWLQAPLNEATREERFYEAVITRV